MPSPCPAGAEDFRLHELGSSGWGSGSARDMLTPFSLATFASELTAEEFGQGGTVAQSTLAGRRL